MKTRTATILATLWLAASAYAGDAKPTAEAKKWS